MGESEVIISWELRGELVIIHEMRRLAALRNDRRQHDKTVVTERRPARFSYLYKRIDTLYFLVLHGFGSSII